MSVVLVVLVVVIVVAVAVAVRVAARRRCGAADDVAPRPGVPRVDRLYYESILHRAGVPVTPHNLFAVQERIGILFTIKAHQFIDGMGTPRERADFVARHGYPERAMHRWPQRVLNGIVDWRGDALVHIRDFPERCADELLETAGTGDGILGDPSRPLPTATDQDLRGIGGAGVRPMLPPGPVAAG